MKNKVFAIGNALVDHEYKLTDTQLEETGLTKGSAQLAMTIEEQQKLVSLLEAQGVQLIKKAGGGSAANTVFAIAALGGSSSLSCRVCDDEAGRFYLQDLTNAGVKTSIQSLGACSDICEEPTGSCMVLVTPDAERTMQTYLGVSSQLGFEHVDDSLLNRAEYIYIEGYLAASESALEAIEQVKKTAHTNDVKIALSFADPSMVNFCKDGLLSILGDGVDVIFANEEEALTFTQTETVDDAVQQLHTHAPLVIVTLGSKGALISNKGDSFVQSAPIVDDVVDTNGAGDNFAGAFMYGLTNDFTLEECAQLSVAVAGQLIQKFGPRMERQDYANLIAEFKG